ncbi:spore germination protein [Paenibacillus mendelii]|uniref:Spore germination protein n=1 Tax=Paenibacillus mendelii TaxID=206163 RepID=A0ABV6JC60_9BACL|nr:spore germination protein [Paenibacillus mendelii]MCQ6562626.1 spore germination protein [Paenibacillus mendelii]
MTTTTPDHKPAQPPSVEAALAEFSTCIDIEQRTFPKNAIQAVYLLHLVSQDQLYREIIRPFMNATDDETAHLLTQSVFSEVCSHCECVDAILNGKAALYQGNQAWIIDLARPIGRTIEQSETESVIAGPHDGFVENMMENLAVIRQRIRSSHLKTVELSVGEVTKTPVIVAYIEGIANPDLLQALIDRIKGIETDAVYEANMLVQMIDDNPNSVFPQFMTTERPDVICSKLTAGRIVCLVDGSPSVFSCPTSFFEFFTSPDDYYQRWQLGTALRLLRIIGFLITIGFTAFYVAVTTYHYEMIPHTMLLNLVESRSRVPFPPLFEALLMETTIELLREAGARLPTKIGQTIGIVGGIVIGQAAVQAGFTSNVLIIAVASSAIASFVIPSYIMSASIRLIRFGLIILAGILGNLGLIVGIGFIVIHLAGITNLGTSYLTPVAPMNKMDWLDSFIRGPFYLLRNRPSQTRTTNTVKTKMRK